MYRFNFLPFWKSFKTSLRLTNAIKQLEFGNESAEAAERLAFVTKHAFSALRGARVEALKIAAVITANATDQNSLQQEAERVSTFVSIYIFKMQQYIRLKPNVSWEYTCL